MDLRLLRCSIAIAALVLSWPVAAQESPQPPAAAAPQCQAPEHEGHPMGDREERIEQYAQLGATCLKRLSGASWAS